MPGAMAQPPTGVVRTNPSAPSAKCSPTKRLACLPCLTTRRRCWSASRSRSARRPMSASTSTIIRSRTRMSGAFLLCLPIPMRCASPTVRTSSPAIGAATTRVHRSKIPPISGDWSTTSVPPVSTAPTTASHRPLPPAKPCSCVPPNAAPISAPSPPPWRGCSNATALQRCRMPSSRRCCAMCRTPTPCAWHLSASASSRVASRPWRSSCPRTCATEMRQCARTRLKPTISSRTNTMQPVPTTERDPLHARAAALNLHGLLTHWGEVASEPLVASLLGWEEHERARRSLERRLRTAHIGRFKPLCDFDWAWPKRCDRAAIDTLMTLEFLNDAANVVLVGPNGVGKSMIAQNIAHQALTRGHTVLFTSAGQLLGDLCALDSDSALRRRLRHYARPHLLVIDEVGYLSYSNRHADLMFELISRRYQNRSTLVTTNRNFAEWREVFPNAACVVSLVDRLLHNSEIVAMKGTQTVFGRHSCVWWLRGVIQGNTKPDFD